LDEVSAFPSALRRVLLPYAGVLFMNIYLIGYRCSGKTSVGRALARRIGWRFVDADDRIAAELGTTITDFVRRKGWEVFRDVEQAVMARLGQTANHVVAAGGGAVLREENIAEMKRSGWVIWLQASAQQIEARMSDDAQTEANRPSLTGKDILEEIAEVLAARSPLYRQAADIVIDTDGIGIQDAVARVLEILPQYGMQSEHKIK
jgi:shikimate kinase